MIKVESISKRYHMGNNLIVHALNNIDLKIKKGELLAIVGSSGSGKSTLLHIIGGLDRPDEGKVVWEGEQIFTLNDQQLADFRNRRIGFVFQQFHLLPKTSVLENVLLPTMYNRYSNQTYDQRAKKILNKLGLGNRLNHHPNELSGGQQQRVAIARAMINQPDVIFADEPTGNLDSESGINIIRILKELNREEKITVFIVTHDLELADRTRRIIKMKDGKIISDEKNV
jgi:ABC-type lipoprotein export system ATPase subunit